MTPLFQDRFFVPGTAKGKARPRAVALGKHARVYPGGADLEWKASIRLAMTCRIPQEQLTGPVELSLEFQVQRPKSHYGAKGLKPSAPLYCTAKPDLDNSAGAVMDAITEAGLWRDDALVVTLRAQKRYVVDGEIPGVWIEVEEL